MSLLNGNPFANSGGSGGGDFELSMIPKVYQYEDLGTTVNQQLWKVMHPNFDRTKDKAIIYLNGVLVGDEDWTIEDIDGELFARIPLAGESLEYVTTPPTLSVLVVTNALGN